MRFLCAAGALLATVALAPANLQANAGSAGPFVGIDVRERLVAEGRVRVLVSRSAAAAAPGEGLPGLQVVRSLASGSLLAGWLTPQGLDRIGRDRSIRAVVLDRIVRPAGQVGTAQIGVDRLQTAGLTGFGRAIGIVDTGIDLYHPDFGTTAAGNGRVVGGWSFADDNADLSDCAGHGTAVAGVAAGTQGIAPEASVVALKVFGARDGCTSAFASDVLSAVEWAIGHRRELRIDVLNLSLADGRTRSGFCDAEDPISASVFARARAEGLVVVAAAGNGGRADSLSWPACHSDVVSVGMVYSAGQGPTSWDGEAGCTDAATGPDVVPCASNSGAALSVLAPGVRWLAPTAGGGRHTTFSGTSAAAPAAAGSLLLARQARPARDPSLSADLLRLTGVPVTDGRTGKAAPRIDAGAAFFSTSPVTGPCGRVQSHGGAREATECHAEISALVGSVSSLTVALSLEHPKLSGVRAFLTGPDGTTVRLLDGVGREGSVFREVIGRTYPSDEPLSGFAGRPAEGGWTLRLENDDGLATERLTSWALLVEPESPRHEETPGPFTELIPTVARNGGLYGAFFSTDIVLFNPDESSAADVTLSFDPSGDSVSRAVSVGLRLPPLTTRTLADVVGNAFRTTGFGPVRVSAPESVVVASRTDSTAGEGGAYGLLARGVGRETAIGAGEPSAWLAPVFHPGTSRVNVGFVEVGGASASVELLVRDGGGSVKGRVSFDLEPYGSRQANDIHRLAAATATPGDLFEIRVRTGAGRVVGWATAIDNGSNDGLLVTAARPRFDAYIPAVARAQGKFGAYFRTDLKLSNPWPSPVNVRISFFPSMGSEPAQLVLSLGAWETRVFDDLLTSLLGISDDAAGALRLTVLGGAPGIVATSRTYTEEDGKSYGLDIGTLENAEAVAGDRIALTFLASSPETRTNLGFLETFGIETIVKVTLLGASGDRLATRELSLESHQAVQWNDVFAEMAAAPSESASAIVEVLSGGAVIVHAIRVDNRTNDASFLPGRVLRTPLSSSPASR